MKSVRPALALLLLAGATAVAGPMEERFEAANRAYEKGDFAGAEKEYRAILDYGIQAPEVYYNLGNAFFRQGRIGQAILNYERAQRLDPADPDARYNMEYCRQQVADRDAPPSHWLASAYQVWTRAAGAQGEVWLLLVFYLPGSVALGAWILARQERLRRLARFAAAVLLLLALPAGGLVILRAAFQAADASAIVLVDKVEGRSGPGDDNAALFTVHEGLKVQVRNESGGWVQVLLPNGLNGWVPASAVEKV